MKTSRYIIYAVALREHPEIVKLGRTTNWRTRRREYDTWNFAQDDGVAECIVFMVTDEYVDLSSLERACLDAMASMCSLHRGMEWFKGSLAQARTAIEGVLTAGGLSYVEAGGKDSAPKVRRVV